MLKVVVLKVLVTMEITEPLKKAVAILKIIKILTIEEIRIKITKKTKTIKESKIMDIQVDKMGTEIRIVMDMEVQEE